MSRNLVRISFYHSAMVIKIWCFPQDNTDYDHTQIQRKIILEKFIRRPIRATKRKYSPLTVCQSILPADAFCRFLSIK
jgi:hypothetical protein